MTTRTRIKQPHNQSPDQLAIPGVEATAAVARRGDPETSHQAAATVKDLRAAHRRVLQLFRKYGPMTDEELYKVARSRDEDWMISPSGLRSRRAEMTPPRGAGIRATAYTRDTDGKRGAIVWELDEAVRPQWGVCKRRDG